MLRPRGSGRGTVASAPDFPGNTDHSKPHQGHPRTPEVTACHTPPRDVPKLLGTFPSPSLLKGNTTQGRLMQFISSAFSNWKIYWSFNKINSDIAATLHPSLHEFQNSEESQSGYRGQEICCCWAALTILVTLCFSRGWTQPQPAAQHTGN